MNALWTAYLFHIREQIRTKGFRITSIVISLLILGYFAYNHFSSNEKEVLVTVINTSTYYSLDDKILKENIEGLVLHTEQIKNEEKEQQKIKDQDLDHLIVIKEKNSIPVVNYYYHRSPDPTVMFAFTNQLQQQYLAKVSTEQALSQEVISQLFQTIPVEETMLAENNGSLGIVYVFIFLMYTFILMFGQGVAMSITGEKSTRVMEVMITKIKPIYMLFAKVLSSLTAGLIQVSVFFLSGYVAYLIGWINKNQFNIVGFDFDLSQINAGLIVAFVFFFACGYLVYALCFAALGSLISRTEDLGSVMGPVMVLVVGALMVGIKTMMDPTGGLVNFSTYFPFFSPIVAYSKFVMGELTTLELIISGAILVTSILLLAIGASKIYVKGVMVYGEKFKWSHLSAMFKK
ncbi:ABC transporter permease [Neobacillus niacini]|uniref:ABC transporter permease n=1 Tax=Neobacillus niacini TaxID=86668 RepID=UPI0007ABF9CA|nr:ABC transporter permease [Neobacillus niacini]MEC1524238.1 ABC transporter permease [Neobacillus niacini]